ncbi:hypothetical protein ABE527_18545 [Brucella sp. TWI432]
MDIVDVVGLKWLNAEKTILGGTAKSAIFGSVQLCLRDGYDTEAGQKIWDEALAGKYGPIFDYVEPEILPEPVPNEISRRQFFQLLAILGLITKNEAKAALQGGAIPAALQALISQLPDDEQFDAEMLIIGAATFARLHQLCDKIRILFEWTEEQRDNFWHAASKL